MSREPSLAVALGPRRGLPVAMAICSTISKDNTAGEKARHAGLLAYLGRRTRPALVPIPQLRPLPDTSFDRNEEAVGQPVRFDNPHSLRGWQQQQVIGGHDEDNNSFHYETMPLPPSSYIKDAGGNTSTTADPDMYRNYYQDLELPFTANIEDIRKQFKKLALKYHPDRNPGREKESSSKLRAIQEAHEALTDPVRKSRYDELYNVKLDALLGVSPKEAGQRGMHGIHSLPEPVVDVTAVHGLQGHSVKTWRKKERNDTFGQESSDLPNLFDRNKVQKMQHVSVAHSGPAKGIPMDEGEAVLPFARTTGTSFLQASDVNELTDETSTTKHGKPVDAARPSRWGPLFQRQKEVEWTETYYEELENSPWGASALGRVGSPLHNSSLANGMTVNGTNGRQGVGSSLSFASTLWKEDEVVLARERAAYEFHNSHYTENDIQQPSRQRGFLGVTSIDDMV